MHYFYYISKYVSFSRFPAEKENNAEAAVKMDNCYIFGRRSYTNPWWIMRGSGLRKWVKDDLFARHRNMPEASVVKVGGLHQKIRKKTAGPVMMEINLEIFWPLLIHIANG